MLIEQLNLRLKHMGRETVDLTAAAVASIASYGWPGNVRELSNLLERLSILHRGRRIDVDNIPERYRSASRVGRASAAPLPRGSSALVGTTALKRKYRKPGTVLNLRAACAASR